MTWHEPEKNEQGKAKRHSEVVIKNQYTETLREPIKLQENVWYHVIGGDIELSSLKLREILESTRKGGIRISTSGSEGKGIYLSSTPYFEDAKPEQIFRVRVKTTKIKEVSPNGDDESRALFELINGIEDKYSGHIESTYDIQQSIKTGEYSSEWSDKLGIEEDYLIELAEESPINIRNWYEEKLKESGAFITNVAKVLGYDGIKFKPFYLRGSPSVSKDTYWLVVFEPKYVELI